MATRLVYDYEAKQFVPAGQELKRQGGYIPPIAASWFKTAIHLPGKAIAVGAIIHLEAAKRRTREIQLTGRMTSNFGITQMARQRALGALEAAGLIRVHRQFGKSPTVTIIERN
jgi:hypothetical protein